MRLEEVSVTSVSKIEEKQTEAPAAVFAQLRQEIEERPGAHRRRSPQDHSGGGRLPGRPGAVQRSRPGLQQHLFRRAAHPDRLPECRRALAAGRNSANLFPTTNEDIEKIEFVLGPGAALYGPNSANGVLNIITRSPFTSTGVHAHARRGRAGGVNHAGLQRRGMPQPHVLSPRRHPSLWRITGRHAMKVGSKLAFKVSGSYLKGYRVERAGSGRSHRTLTP